MRGQKGGGLLDMLMFDIDDGALTFKSPIQYPGGKHFARQIISDHVPAGTTEIVSPFFGGGHVELFLSKRGIRTHGYDLFEPIVHFWQTLQKHPDDLYKVIVHHLRNQDKEYFENIKKDNGFLYKCLPGDIPRASHFYLIQCLSYNSTGFRGSTVRNYVLNEDGDPVNPTGKSWGIMFNPKEVRDFHNPFISVECMGFEKSLTKHNNLFAYCDPPYPEVSGMYGDSKEFHEDFDHELLKYVLDNRDGEWLLSYNDCETVRMMYPPHAYKITSVSWKQGSRKEGVGNELIIRRKHIPITYF